MSYTGQSLTISCGVGGLHTDDPQSRIPIENIISARNVEYGAGLIEKVAGSLRWNLSALSSGITAMHDWWPDTITQRLIVLDRSGAVTRFVDRESSATVAATGNAPTTLVTGTLPVFVSAGAESVSESRKLFLVTGQNQIQVIAGDGTTRTNIAQPSVDWTSTNGYPVFALLHRSRLVAFHGHRIYLSDVTDHENFVTNTTQFPVFPGEGERLSGGVVYQGRLFMFKYPSGVYYLDDASADSANWAVRKLSSSFGVSSPLAALSIMNDLLVKNSTGSLTSLAATDQFGDVESGDLLNVLRNENYMRQTTSRVDIELSHAAYYEDKKLAYFTYRSRGGTRFDRMLMLDFNSPQRPRVAWIEKDQPNCLALRKDSLGVLRPLYGAEDGYVYQLDRADRTVNGSGYLGEFQTPHMDFGFADPGLAEKMKLFDFLEVTFEETGNFNLNVDVWIDNRFIETITSPLTKNDDYLNQFDLNTSAGTSPEADYVLGRSGQSFRKPLHGAGRRISFKCYNSGNKENFRIQALTIYFRLGSHEQRNT